MRGRKPTPTHLKLLRGNPGKRPINEDEAEVEPGAEAPSWLTEEALAYWKPTAEKLEKAGLLSNVDADALALYCDSLASFVEATKNVKKLGRLVKSPSGYPMQSPWLAIQNKAKEQMMKLQLEFGMTASSRSRISAKPGSEKKGKSNPFLAMVKARRTG